MQEHISPEERLLRLIRKPSRQPDTQKGLAKQSKGVIASVSADPCLDISLFPWKLIWRILIICLVLAAGYLLLDLFVRFPKKTEEIVTGPPKLNQQGLNQQAAAKPLSYYNAPLESAHLFTSVTEASAHSQAVPILRELTSRLRLQGVIAGESPQAVIEDNQSGQVYFLSPGEFAGEIMLKDILPGKVKLDYHGQEIELFL